MDTENLVSTKLLEIIAFDVGLLILAGWFVIMWLILTEFRKFAVKVTKGHGKTDHMLLEDFHDSINSALNFSSENRKTINALARVQENLESQLSIIQESAADNLSHEDKAKIDALNNKLKQAHQLIEKLEGDLSTSVKRLKATKEKLYAQYDSAEALKKENQELSDKFEQLENEYIQLSDNGRLGGDSGNLANNELKKTLGQYKRKMDEQDQVIKQLMEQNSSSGNQDIKSLEKKLAAAENSLKNLGKEKEFVEAKYLELANKNQDN